MRFLQRSSNGELSLTNDLIGGSEVIPRYAILSHTWEEGQEVTYQDLIHGNGTGKNGYRKLQFCAERSAQAGLNHFWVDTCCIDKSSSAELQEAIASMFRWYSKADVCFVYLSDVDHSQRWQSAFRKSRWFKRGWTLQELLAPADVEFYSNEGTLLGTKRTLEDAIHEITRINYDALRGKHLSGFPKEERLSWTSERETKREEDAAYSLLGIFDVHMPLMYGEGRKHALERLEEQIDKQTEAQRKDLLAKRDREQEERKQELRQALKSTLLFDQMHARQSIVKAAHASTCEWLLYQQEYIDWLDPSKLTEHNGLLWIKGKPGAGKSTLMKYALTQSRRTASECTTISFFFNARGTILEKSIIGTYRSLLWQILDKYPETLPVLDTVVSLIAGQNLATATVNWTTDTLQSLLSLVISGLTEKSVLCFIDALDECEEEQIREMIQFLENLGTAAVASRVSLRICLSSRHYPHITIRQGIILNLDGHEGHSQDIRVYLRTALKIERSRFAQEIRAKIQARASGVFMWVVLVVAILNREHDHGRIHRLLQRLDEIPSGLHELFHDTLTRDTNNSDETLLCIRLLLFAREVLTPEQFYHAILSGTEPDALSECSLAVVTANDMERFILSSSKGLAEVTKISWLRVQFIHESVQDYLTRPEKLGSVWPDLEDNFEGQSHEQMKQCCLHYLSIAAFDNPDRWKYTYNYPPLTDAYPFLRYALMHVMHHAEAAAKAGIDQRGFIREFPLPKFIAFYNIFWDRYPQDVSLLYLLAERNLSNLVKIHPSRLLYLERERSLYECPLFAALACGNKEVVQIFVAAHAAILTPESALRRMCERYLTQGPPYALAPHTSSEHFPVSKSTLRSQVSRLVEMGDDLLLALALDAKKRGLVNLDVDLWDGGDLQTPLLLAVRLGYSSMARMLLETGQVDVNARDFLKRTPLMRAASNGDEAIVKILLDTGKINVKWKDYIGMTALRFAEEAGNRTIVEWLMGMRRQSQIPQVLLNGRRPWDI